MTDRSPPITLITAMAAVLVAFGAVTTLQISEAQACDACNNAFEREILEERSDTLAGQDIIQAMENQAQFDSLTYSEGAEPGTVADTDTDDLAQAQADIDVDSLADSGAVAQAGDANPGAVAAADTPGSVAAAAAPQEFEDVYGDDEQFIEILERDENLENTPPTGYVSQDAEPDEEVTVELDEGQTYLGQGVVYDGFLMDGKIPGPTVQVNQGDVVRMNFKNTGSVPHGASIHSAYTQTSAHVGEIDPGDTKSVTFRATYPGVFMYHCAPGGHAIPMHVMAGQYGMMVVEPEEDYKLEKELEQEPDLSLYMIQNELYASGTDAVDGNEKYTTFNGRVFRYVEEPIAVEPGDYVRMYFLNVGPNLLSTFHIVGIIWDYVYWQGHPDAKMPGGQSVTAGPTDSWVIEFRIPPEEGAYTMLSHAVGSTSRGAIGLLAAEEGADGPDEVLADGPEFSEEEIAEKAEQAVRTLSMFGPNSMDKERPKVYGPDVDEVFVDIKGNAYDQPVIEIEPGTKVTWTNEDVFTYLDGEFSGIHNAVGTDGPEEFATSMLAHGESDSVVFEEPGTYNYICTPHPYMEGKIIVREPAEDDAQTGCTTVSAGGAIPVAVAMLALVGLAVIRRRSPQPAEVNPAA